MQKLNELNTEELTLVFHNNRKLQAIVFDDMMEDAHFWNTEYLDCWQRGSVDYSIGYDRGTFFKCKNRNGFIDGLKKAQKTYCFLADEYNKTIEHIETILAKMNDDSITCHQYDILENAVNELIEELESACYRQFISAYEYCFNDDNVLDYFINFYVDTRDTEEYFINDDYTLFKHIDYIESYN